ncbi:amidohydrolase family protein [Nostoc punctiforme UO1]|uniref:amidohydrolase family protein n=1 Tax=Nostoc punctiforme TaxID=272131 RepID=UPI0030AF25E7
MVKEYSIIDADSHVFEPFDMWENYLEPAYKSFAPSPDMKIQGEDIYYKASSEVVAQWNKQIMQAHPMAQLNGFTNELHVLETKKMGVDISFIYPTLGMSIIAIDTMEPSLAGAFTRAYNNWLYQDFCSYNPKILKGVGMINLHAPEEMVSELYRIAEFNCKAVCLRPNPVKGRLLSNPAYEPFWTECEKLGVAVSIHEGTHSRLPTVGADRFNTRFALRCCSHPMEQMMAMLALIEGGVLERHPQLRVGFLESGCGWLIYWLWRLDEEFECHYWEVKDNVKIKPSEYFKRQCFIGYELGEPGVKQVIEYVGADKLIFGSDYPHVHWGQKEGGTGCFDIKKVLQEQLPRETVKKILWDNPAHFYGLQ